MSKLKRVAIGIAIVIPTLVIGLITAASFRYDRVHEVPLPDVTASTDPAVLEHGEYLVWGPGHCAGCHGAVEDIEKYEASGERIPLSGGFEFPIPLGTFVSPNITSHETAGIGAMSDAELARSLRHGVNRDGQMLFPIMPFANLTEQDMLAVVSYLRALPADDTVRPQREITMLGKVIFAFAMEPLGPKGPVPESIEAGPTVEYGDYLANSVANCYGCHTMFDMATGDFIGEPFAGGMELEHRGKVFTIPNITPGGEGSRIKTWTKESFIERVRTGKPSAEGSPMPWVPYSKLSDEDLTALWLYLQSVPSVDNDTGPALKGE